MTALATGGVFRDIFRSGTGVCVHVHLHSMQLVRLRMERHSVIAESKWGSISESPANLVHALGDVAGCRIPGARVTMRTLGDGFREKRGDKCFSGILIPTPFAFSGAPG